MMVVIMDLCGMILFLMCWAFNATFTGSKCFSSFFFFSGSKKGQNLELHHSVMFCKVCDMAVAQIKKKYFKDFAFLVSN